MRFTQLSSVENIIAVNVGFSKDNPTTGFAFRINGISDSGQLSFADTLHKIHNLLQSLKGSVVLILAAPLSYYFQSNKPYPRLLKHETLIEVIERGDRAWYIHSGALAALAAQRFLVMLFTNIDPADKEMMIVEGLFVNGKNQESHDNPYVRDAELLCDGFDPEKLMTPVVDYSVLDLFGSDHTAPKVLTVRYT